MTLLSEQQPCEKSHDLEDNGASPRNYTKKLMELKDVNSWIIKFNAENGKNIILRFHRFGGRDCMVKDCNDKKKRVKQHILSCWCKDKPKSKRIMLTPAIRIKMGIAVNRHFAGEMERNGIFGQHLWFIGTPLTFHLVHCHFSGLNTTSIGSLPLHFTNATIFDSLSTNWLFNNLFLS